MKPHVRLILLCFALVHGLVHGQGVPTTRLWVYDLDSATTALVQDPQIGSLPSTTFHDRQTMGLVTVGLDPQVNWCYSQYVSYEVDVDVDYKTWDANLSTLVSHTVQKTFEIDFAPYNHSNYVQEENFFIPGAYEIEIDITSVTARDSLGTVLTFNSDWDDYPGDLYFQAQVDVERFGDFDPNTAPSGLNFLYSSNLDQIQIRWAAPTNGETHFDVEWTWVDAHDSSSANPNTMLPHNQVYANFSMNSTRVRVPSSVTKIVLPNVFDRGYLVARVRGVGRNPSDLEHEVVSTWTFNQNYNSPSLLSTIPSNAKFTISGHEPDKNWMLQISYAEDGKNKHVVSYADGSSRVRQQVTYLSTQQEAVVGQTIYDHQGRPGVTILPAPAGHPRIKYYEDFNVSAASQAPYSRVDFDLDSLSGGNCVPNPIGLDDTSGASHYYSTSNTNLGGIQGYVPDAYDFPMSVVQYTPDNTGRIRRQGGVGPDHQAGSGHETRYFYGKPQQEQLDMLFGTDVGYASHYKKQMVIDANGQVSVSYMDMAGRVVATSLAGQEPSNLIALRDSADTQDLPDAEKVVVVSDLLNKSPNYPQGKENHLSQDLKRLEVISSLLVAAPQTYTFDYELIGLDFLDSCLQDLCMDCVYDVSISIKDDCGNEQLDNGAISVRLGGGADTACNATDTFQVQQFTATLDVGSYTIEKVVSLNDSVLDIYAKMYLERDTCLLTVDDFFEMPDTTGCDITCDVCESTFASMGSRSTYIQNRIQELIDDSVAIDDTTFFEQQYGRYWDDYKSNCDQVCNDPGADLCESGYKMMLADMSPGGQYAEFDEDVNGNVVTTGYLLSILRPINLLKPRLNSQISGIAVSGSLILASWRNPRYLDASGNWVSEYRNDIGERVKIYLNEVTPNSYTPAVQSGATIHQDPNTLQSWIYPEDLAHVEDFIANWDPEFAKSLVVYHPEYLHYEWCRANTYDRDTLNGDSINTWQLAGKLRSMTLQQAKDILGCNLDPRDVDPFYTYQSSTTLTMPFNATTVGSLIDGKMIKTAKMNTNEALNAWELSYGTEELGPLLQMSPFPNIFQTLYPDGCIQDLATFPPCTTSNCSLVLNENGWQSIVGYYMSAQQQAVQFGMLTHALAKGVSNQCIGNTNYVPQSFTFSNNPCSDFYFPLYYTKTPRFPTVDHYADMLGLENDPFDEDELKAKADQQYFNEYGVCPKGRDVEQMIAQLIQKSKLNQSNVRLTLGPFLGSGLFTDLLSSNDTMWNPQFSGNNRYLLWDMNRSNDFSLKLPPGAPSWANFTNLTFVYGIHDIVQVGGQATFKLHGQFSNGSNQTSVVLEGSIYMTLTGCESSFEAVCAMTDEALELKNLMAVLKAGGRLFSTTAVNLTQVEAQMIAGAIGPKLGGSGTFSWRYDDTTTPEEFRLIHNPSGKGYRIELSGGWGSFNPAAAFHFLRFSSPNSTTSTPQVGGDIVWEVIQPNPAVPPLILNSTQASHSINLITSKIGSGHSSLTLTDCDFLESLECSDQDVDNWEALKSAAQLLITNGGGGSGPDSTTSCFSSMTWLSDGSTVSSFSSLQYLSIEPDFASSPNGGHHTDWFFLRVKRPGNITDTIHGKYCKKFRLCEDCESCTEAEDLVLNFYLPASEEYTTGVFYNFDMPGDDCIDIQPQYFTLPDTMTEVQAATYLATLVNNNNGNITANAQGNLLRLTIPTSALGADCPCDENLPVTFSGNEAAYVSAVIRCCEEPEACVPTDSLELAFYMPFNYGQWQSGDSLYFDEFLDGWCSDYTLPKYVAPTINNSMDYDNWLSSIVADINANHPPFEASYQSNHIYLYLPTQFLNSTCACGDGQTDQVYIFRDRSGMENPVRNASIYCCKEAPSGCTLSLQNAQEDYETDLIGQQAWYDSQMSIWYNNCQDSITDSCSNALAAIDSIHLSEVTRIEHYWDSVITALSAGCGLWEADDTLQWGSPCDAVLEPFPEYPLTDDCVEHLLNVAWHNAKVAWEAYRDSVEQAFRRGYTAHCMQALEKFDMEYEDQEYHFTLYYYDQAGSLVKTVPPLAVKRLDTADLATVRARRDSGGVNTLRPWHHVPGTSFYQLATDYRYNSLDQPILQRSPDGGTTAFWYDELGRLVFSQNGRQQPNNQYSFTDYDALGRITKVGQFVNPSTLTQAIAGLSSSRSSWLFWATQYREITSTYYDVTPSFSSHSQTELRNRVAAITFEQADDGNAATYDAASFYGYDMHGNVNVLWQYNQDLEDLGSGQGTRVLHYYYDLVSGNVRSVAYNPNGRDRYFHRYRYDADNRITRVETWEGADWSQMGWSFNQWTATENPLESIEVWPWEEDAAYAYYDHGPLARTELGDLKVQGMDYLYTIHGWIKGINSNSLDVDRDPGRDGKDTVGNANRLVGADALSYSLHYYGGDYAPINGTSSYNATYHVSGYGGSLVDLWNGNIAGMVTTLQDIQTHAAQPQGAQYRYDQLNRIKEMQVWQDMDVINNQWQSSSALGDYRTSYRYDANGNILNLNRNGHNSVNLAMDSLSYHYISGTNRLAYVDDAVAAGNYSVDIDDQAVGNYAYDATGNLIKDVAEEIDSIVWTAYGKVLKVVRSSVSSKPDLHFAYGPDGNRLSKKAVYGNDSTVWTFYVRDAQGNTMATYKHKESSGVLHLTDHVLYGSSRLGSHERKHVELLGAGSSPITARAGIYGLERGDKRYALSNHLGNVLAVVSDRRAKASCADTLVRGYWADIMSTTDYYPFGMGMVERGLMGGIGMGLMAWNATTNGRVRGMPTILGQGCTMGDWGGFWGVDPMFSEYPFLNPFQFAGNSPINKKDVGGEYIFIVNENPEQLLRALHWFFQTDEGKETMAYFLNNPDDHLYLTTADYLLTDYGHGGQTIPCIQCNGASGSFDQNLQSIESTISLGDDDAQHRTEQMKRLFKGISFLKDKTTTLVAIDLEMFESTDPKTDSHIAIQNVVKALGHEAISHGYLVLTEFYKTTKKLSPEEQHEEFGSNSINGRGTAGTRSRKLANQVLFIKSGEDSGVFDVEPAPDREIGTSESPRVFKVIQNEDE